MIQVDLITGFLGSGKTTFIRKYAAYLVGSGKKVGIIENDFGAINVDMLLLADIDTDRCDVEQIVGGSVVSDWKRRFKAKLIAMAMQGFERVLVEPSGIYDVDAFFDVLYEEPVCNWYEPGTIVTIVDAVLEQDLSQQARYLMVSQLANAGAVVFSKVSQATNEQLQGTIDRLNEMLSEFHCTRRLESGIVSKPWDELTETDFEQLMRAGWVSADHEKLWFDSKEAFTSLFFMDVNMTAKQLQNTVKALFEDTKCGQIFRIKGFFKGEDGAYLEINATHDHFTFKPIANAQEVIIVIGQNLEESAIRAYLSAIGS